MATTIKSISGTTLNLAGRGLDDLDGEIDYENMTQLGHVEVWKYDDQIIPVCDNCWVIAGSVEEAAKCCMNICPEHNRELMSNGDCPVVVPPCRYNKNQEEGE